MKSILSNFLYFIQVIAIASPKAIWIVVDEVGTKLPGPASFTLGNKNFTFAFLYKRESFFDVMPISFILLFLDAYWIIFFNSSLSPLKLINIIISLEVTCPISPWLAFEASKKNDGVPVDERVADHFFPTIPLFPTPEIITFPFLQFKIVLIICSKDLPIFDWSFFKDSASSFITSLAIFSKFLFFILVRPDILFKRSKV